MADYSVEFDMNDMNLVMRILKEYEAKIISNTYHEKNILTFQVKRLHAQALETKFNCVYTIKLSPLPTTEL
jgi:putative IMPACT (imprinted ancient) family translation regulator